MTQRPIKLTIAALGGQGGGVLADWLIEIAESEGYIAQSTSVPGVAQRTGATIYYLEFFPRAEFAQEVQNRASLFARQIVDVGREVAIDVECLAFRYGVDTNDRVRCPRIDLPSFFHPHQRIVAAIDMVA